jgi:hypothetical protein
MLLHEVDLLSTFGVSFVIATIGSRAAIAVPVLKRAMKIVTFEITCTYCSYYPVSPRIRIQSRQFPPLLPISLLKFACCCYLLHELLRVLSFVIPALLVWL